MNVGDSIGEDGPSPAASRPDYVLVVHSGQLGDSQRLSFRWEEKDRRGCWTSRPLTGAVLPTAGAREYVTKVLGALEKLEGGAGDEAFLSRARAGGLGLELGRDLLTRPLAHCLWDARASDLDPELGAPTLYLLSNEIWIPWELVRLTDPVTGAPGPFLVEAFALARFVSWRVPAAAVALDRVAWVGSGPAAAEELTRLRELLGDGSLVTELPERAARLLRELRAGRFDAWHFAAHGGVETGKPDLTALRLDHFQRLSPAEVTAEAYGLGGRRPMIFLNACHTARSGESLAHDTGLIDAFLHAGAGAVMGTHWAVSGSLAGELALHFYCGLRQGLGLAEALRRARRRLARDHPGDATWLAYALFADPLARSLPPGRGAVAADFGAAYQPRVAAPVVDDVLELPERSWIAGESTPAALLQAEYGVVPFHGRDRESDELLAWALDERPLAVMLTTGPGGQGKTRLALELCRRMRNHGWGAGFLPNALEADRLRETWPRFEAEAAPFLFVIDYAETRRPLIVELLRQAAGRGHRHPVRLLLLARNRLEWWDQLQSEGGKAGELLRSPATSRLPLSGLAMIPSERQHAYRIATEAFAAELDRPVPEVKPGALDPPHYERVLLLHMRALAEVQGEAVTDDELDILDWALGRERRYWGRQAQRLHLLDLEPGIGRAMALLTLEGGAATRDQALERIQALPYFRDQPRARAEAVAQLLATCYGGPSSFIEPLQPDTLGEHLVRRELESGAYELLELALKPTE